MYGNPYMHTFTNTLFEYVNEYDERGLRYCWRSFGISLVSDSTVQTFFRCPWFVSSFNKTNNNNNKPTRKYNLIRGRDTFFLFILLIRQIQRYFRDRSQKTTNIFVNHWRKSVNLNSADSQYIQNYLVCVHFITTIQIFCVALALGYAVQIQKSVVFVCMRVISTCVSANRIGFGLLCFFFSTFGFCSIRAKKIHSIHQPNLTSSIQLLCEPHYTSESFCFSISEISRKKNEVHNLLNCRWVQYIFSGAVRCDSDNINCTVLGIEKSGSNQFNEHVCGVCLVLYVREWIWDCVRMSLLKIHRFTCDISLGNVLLKLNIK